MRAGQAGVLLLIKDGVRSTDSKTAHVLVGLNLEVSIHTPVTAPGVLDKVEVHVFLVAVTVANSENSVVDSISALGTVIRGVDSTSVVHEVGLDTVGNADGSNLSELLDELVFVTRGDVVGLSHLEGNLGGIKLALEIHAVVLVGTLSLDSTSPCKVLKGLRWETTTASVVVESLSTVNELLLRQVQKLTRVDGMVGLESSSGGESPATAQERSASTKPQKNNKLSTKKKNAPNKHRNREQWAEDKKNRKKK